MSQADHPLGDLYARPAAGAPLVLGLGYREPRGRATATRWLFILSALVDVGLFLAEAQRHLLLNRAPSITLDQWNSNANLIDTLNLVSLLLVIVTAISLLAWLHLCYRDLRALDVRNLRFSPGWAVGWWFIPFLNLVRVKQVMNDLWRVTDSDADVEGADWRTFGVDSIVNLWYGAWFSAAIVSFVASKLPRTTLGEIRTATNVYIGAHLIDLVAVIFAYQLVGAITARLEARAAARPPD